MLAIPETQGQWVWVIAPAALLAAWAVPALFKRWQRMRRERKRALVEDVLKQIYNRRQEGHEADVDFLAERLGLPAPRLSGLLQAMEAEGLVRVEGRVSHLTPEGERRALQVVRAHRLWETYLAHEARVPAPGLHRPAEREEHRLTPAQVEQLEAVLGHPQRDPHGDPIPTATGEVTAVESRALTEWPAGQSAEIVHVEDEPEAVFRDVAAQGLHAGQLVRVTERTPEIVVLTDGEKQYRLTPLAAAHVQVAAASAEPAGRSGLERLSDLALGEEAEVVLLDGELRGFTRRRLLDLGLTPGARVTAVLSNAFGDPRAFRVRGTTIALRKEQARHVWVRRCAMAQVEEKCTA
ncbi:MAG TPA: metal-dependent transcriptional regulator [Bryobacteraceae bacterium]|nr:metal-dependent transcriptional regulator [Bryobacteraceae bacterium]